eukprot:SAG11_NODE_34328_length_272_cov_1.196532_1_plen_89_part_10
MSDIDEQLARALEDRRRLLDYVVGLAIGDKQAPRSPAADNVIWPQNTDAAGGDDICGRHVDAQFIDVDRLLEQLADEQPLDLSNAAVPR